MVWCNVYTLLYYAHSHKIPIFYFGQHQYCTNGSLREAVKGLACDGQEKTTKR